MDFTAADALGYETSVTPLHGDAEHPHTPLQEIREKYGEKFSRKFGNGNPSHFDGWLGRPNTVFGGKTPKDLIVSNRSSEVVTFIERLL